MPNNETDRLIFEKVMGWPLKESSYPLSSLPAIHPVTRKTWSPSTNDSDALEVLERLRPQGYYAWGLSFNGHGYEARVSTPKGMYCEYGPTLCATICTLALKVLGEE